MGIYINYQATPDFCIQINNRLTEIKNDLKPFIVDLSEKEKQGRSMAEGREGMVRLISKIALAHPDSLSKKDNPTDLEIRLDYDSDLETLRQSLLTLIEGITDTQLANSMDAMTLSDRYINNLQNDRNNSSSLDLALREVDEWNKRFANDPKETPPPKEEPPKDGPAKE
ncbi:MAG: hypothetical protein WC756_03935 [Taibaiella sp.]|jgi:hypothetical protein